MFSQPVVTFGPSGAGHYLLNRTPEGVSCSKKMSLKRKESHVDSRAKNGAIFFVVCKPNPATFVKIPSVMRAKGYSDKESKDKTMQMQVHREIGKIKGGDPIRPPEAAAEAAKTLLTLSAPSNATNRRALATITSSLPVAASVAASAAFLDGIC